MKKKNHKIVGLKFKKVLVPFLFVLTILTTPILALSYDINEKFAVEGTLTGVCQYGDYDVKGMDNKDRGAAVFDLGINFHPSESDEFQVTLGFAAGNGLNGLNPLSLTPYADDLEDDLKNINGRDRDYLLEAWYKHTFKLDGDTSLAVTGGIIDSTAFIDDNAFANDETGQFMNEVFVNHRNVNLPSYDLGGAVEMNISNISIRGVVMNTKHESGDDVFTNYNYYALQLGYALETSLGKGNYRIYGFTTSKRFEDWNEAVKERLKGIGLSFDQELSQIVGVFARAGWQDDAAVIDHQTLYSGGVNINGKLWGREKDQMGIGYAYLIGADDSDIDNTNALESYIKFQISKYNDISLDIQYVDDKLRHDEDRKGFVYGIRANTYF